MMYDLKGLKYASRLKQTKLTTLETRRIRSDLVETYKIFNGLEGLDRDSMFVLNHRISRGNVCKLLKKRARLDVKKFCFSHRVVEHWNSLSDEAVAATSVNVFKGFVDCYLRKYRDEYKL